MVLQQEVEKCLGSNNYIEALGSDLEVSVGVLQTSMNLRVSIPCPLSWNTSLSKVATTFTLVKGWHNLSSDQNLLSSEPERIDV